MAKMYSLCSSSKGNCTYIGDDNLGILVDAGIGIRNFASSMMLAGLDANNIKAIFITHEHIDHISGLKNLTSKLKVPVYASKGTLTELLRKGAVDYDTKLYEINKKAATIFDMQVNAFHTSHDSAESLGYKITLADNKKIAVCTDLGYVSDEVRSAISDCNLVLLESNYDEKMLMKGFYPYFIKNRIMSERGHLSNNDCSSEIINLINSGVEHFVLGHLSENNNHPEIALQNVLTELSKAGIRPYIDFTVDIAQKRNTGKVVCL